MTDEQLSVPAIDCTLFWPHPSSFIFYTTFLCRPVSATLCVGPAGPAGKSLAGLRLSLLLWVCSGLSKCWLATAS